MLLSYFLCVAAAATTAVCCPRAALPFSSCSAPAADQLRHIMALGSVAVRKPTPTPAVKTGTLRLLVGGKATEPHLLNASSSAAHTAGSLDLLNSRRFVSCATQPQQLKHKRSRRQQHTHPHSCSHECRQMLTAMLYRQAMLLTSAAGREAGWRCCCRQLLNRRRCC